MKKLVLFICMVFLATACFAGVSYEIKEVVETVPQQDVVVKKTYFVDIYINKEKVVENLQVSDLSKVKELCQSFLLKWNEGREKKIIINDISNISVKTAEVKE